MKYVVCALLALVLAGCSTAVSNATKDRLKLPGVLAYELNLPSLVAVARDFFGEENIEIEDFVPPQLPEGEVSKLTGLFHPVNSTVTMARATTARINAFGLELSHDGKNGHSAPFSWAA